MYLHRKLLRKADHMTDGFHLHLLFAADHQSNQAKSFLFLGWIRKSYSRSFYDIVAYSSVASRAGQFKVCKFTRWLFGTLDAIFVDAFYYHLAVV